MKTALMLCILAGSVLAAGSGDIVQCDKDCCTSNGGDWDSEYEYCDLDASDDQEGYERCFQNCVEEVYGEGVYTGGLCCPAIAGLLVLLGVVIKR